MKKIYDITTKEIIKEFTKSFQIPEDLNPFNLRKSLREGGNFSRKEILYWFSTNFPKIKKGTINAHLLLLSTNAPSRIHYNVHNNGEDDLLFQEDQSHFRLFTKENDPAPIYFENTNISEDEIESMDDEENISGDNSQEFAFEKDLRNFLSKNLEIIESGLKLFVDGDINGIEYPVGGRFIDILAVDSNNDFVVIELKVSKGYDRVIGQLLRYMGWIEQNQADNQKVRGMIICKSISNDLKLACLKLHNVLLYEYDLSISLKQIRNDA